MGPFSQVPDEKFLLKKLFSGQTKNNSGKNYISCIIFVVLEIRGKSGTNYLTFHKFISFQGLVGLLVIED